MFVLFFTLIRGMTSYISNVVKVTEKRLMHHLSTPQSLPTSKARLVVAHQLLQDLSNGPANKEADNE